MPALIDPALQASGELLAGLWAFTVILVSIATPVIVFLLVRFLWSRTVYVSPTPAMWAMMREWQRAALHAEHEQHEAKREHTLTGRPAGYEVRL